MRIGVDFDRVLFDTDSFDEGLKNNTDLHHTEEDVYDEQGCYSPEKHAAVCDVEVERVYGWIRNSGKYTYDDVSLLEDLEGHELVLVTRGHERFQRAKIESADVEKYFDRIVIVQEAPKDEAGIDLLVDDSQEEHARTDVPGIVFDREEQNLGDVLELVKAREGENMV